MKLLLPFLLLFAAIGAAAAASDVVLDTDGNALKRGTKYYILQSPGIGGGLRLGRRNGSCPFFVAKASSEVDPGLPVSFYPVDKGDKAVRLARDTNVVFTAVTTCVQSGVWRLQGDATDRLFVSADGVVGNPGVETLSNWFRIEKADASSSTYKLAFCPGVCNFCRPICGGLGLFVEDGTAWLRLNGEPLSVEFRKV